MTDLEITRLCARAMELKFEEWKDSIRKVTLFRGHLPNYDLYDPLHDDVQAMALVKRFNVELLRGDKWRARCEGQSLYEAWADNLNRAICLCVAKMQQSAGA